MTTKSSYPVPLTDLTDPIHRVLKPLGFIRRNKRTWRRQTDFATQLVYLQQSQYGPRNWIEAGQNVNMLQETTINHPAGCDIRFFFEQANPDRECLERTLDRENTELTQAARATFIEASIKAHLVPVLQAMLSLKGLEAMCRAWPSMNHLAIAYPTSAKWALPTDSNESG